MRRAHPLIVMSLLLSACVSTGTTVTSTAPLTSAASPTVAPPTSAASPGFAAWRRIADIPTARNEVATAVSGRLGVFVMGGSGGPQRVERYDASTDTWDRRPDLPLGVDHPMAAAIEGLQVSAQEGVFLFGGNNNGSATARAFLLDTLRPGGWVELAPMPGPRAAAAAVAVGASIFIVGGTDGGRLVAPTYEYNVVSQQWRTRAPIPTPRDHLAAVALDGRVCAVGGRTLSMAMNLPTFECYDPQADAWARLPDMPTARGGIGAIQHDRRIYVVGGEQPRGTYRELEVFDARTGSWTRGPDLPTARHGLGVAVAAAHKELVGGELRFTSARLLVLTGGPLPGDSQTAVCEALDLP